MAIRPHGPGRKPTAASPALDAGCSCRDTPTPCVPAGTRRARSTAKTNRTGRPCTSRLPTAGRTSRPSCSTGALTPTRGRVFEMTPLHWRCDERPRRRLPGLLTRRGARADARNAYGMTPCHLAADDQGRRGAGQGRRRCQRPRRPRQDTACIRPAGLGGESADREPRGSRIRTPQGRTAMELAAVDTTESAGLSVPRPHAGASARAHRSGQGHAYEITTRPMDAFVLSGHSPACSVDVTPTHCQSAAGSGGGLHPGPSFGPPTHPRHSIPCSSLPRCRHKPSWTSDLRINTEGREILKDSGMIRLARAACGPRLRVCNYLAYVAVPCSCSGLGFLFRRRRTPGE